VFQDGHEIEAAIEAIRSRPGTEDYDIVLEAPFPNIEIVRWHQKGRGSADPDVKHWFTLDNRRLYCLQRAAVAYWPRRVGAVVEVLYNATDGIWRKDDSSTAGCSVSIGHSLKAIVGRWSWREAILVGGASAAAATAAVGSPPRDQQQQQQRQPQTEPRDAKKEQQEQLAHALVIADDKKPGVAALQNAPAPPSMLDLFFAEEATDVAGEKPAAQQQPERQQKSSDAEDSTASTVSPRSRTGSNESDTASVDRALSALLRVLGGRWRGERGESYSVQFASEATWTCWRLPPPGAVPTGNGNGAKKSTLWYDVHGDLLWWGSGWNAVCASGAQLCRQPERLSWYDGRDARARRPRFTWQRLEDLSPGTANEVRLAEGAAAAHRRPWARRGKRHTSRTPLGATSAPLAVGVTGKSV